MNTRRYPRTMEGAFGPYHRSSTAVIVPMDTKQPLHPADRLVLRASLCALAALIVIFIIERT